MKVDEERWVFVKQIPNWVRWVLMNSFFFILLFLLLRKFIYKTKMECIRAIRTRTVDFLGKTDKTYFYRNDFHCFKDPTCIFLHWALSSTDVKIS